MCLTQSPSFILKRNYEHVTYILTTMPNMSLVLVCLFKCFLLHKCLCIYICFNPCIHKKDIYYYLTCYLFLFLQKGWEKYNKPLFFHTPDFGFLLSSHRSCNLLQVDSRVPTNTTKRKTLCFFVLLLTHCYDLMSFGCSQHLHYI